MKRMFIETSEFRHRWSRLGLGEEDLRELQGYLLEHPSAGDTVQGTGGVRKLRWARPGRGKSGGVRTIYIDFADRETTWLITVFGKNEQTDLSPEERSEIKRFVKKIKE
jgi:RelE toxin of RelE / RelB toxin-antitoxin system